jgi:hypothetical protein
MFLVVLLSSSCQPKTETVQWLDDARLLMYRSQQADKHPHEFQALAINLLHGTVVFRLGFEETP